MIDISLKRLVSDLEEGLTRHKKDDQGLGSIEGKYNMTPKEVDIIFRHPKLKDLKPAVFRFRLIDDTDESFDVPQNTLNDEISAPITGKLRKSDDDVMFVEAPRAAAEISIPGSELTDLVSDPKPAGDKTPVAAVQVDAQPHEEIAQSIATPAPASFDEEEEAAPNYMGLL